MLEEIKAAEAAAAVAKKEAAVTARNILREAEETANSEASVLVTNARAEAKKLVAAAEEAAKVKSREIVAERARIDRSAAMMARVKLPEAVAYIVERVVV